MVKLQFLITAIVFLAAACGGQEEREAKYLERGQELFEQGDFVKAQLEFRNALQINPKGVKAQYALGLIDERQGNWQDAFARFSKVVEEDPKHAEAHLKLAHLYLLGNELDKVDEQIATLERLTPETADLYAVQASLAMRRGQSGEAQLLAEGALTKEPGHVGASMVLASSFANQGDVPGAFSALDQAIERHPEEAPLRLLRIKLNLDNNNVEDTVTGYRELIALQPDAFQYRISLAQLFASRDRIDDAEAVLREAVEADVGGTQAKLAIVDLLAQKSGFAAAESELKALMADAPEEYAYAFKLADLYAKNDRTGDAEAILAGVVEADEEGRVR